MADLAPRGDEMRGPPRVQLHSAQEGSHDTRSLPTARTPWMPALRACPCPPAHRMPRSFYRSGGLPRVPLRAAISPDGHLMVYPGILWRIWSGLRLLGWGRLAVPPSPPGPTLECARAVLMGNVGGCGSPVPPASGYCRGVCGCGRQTGQWTCIGSSRCLVTTLRVFKGSG